MILLLQPPDPLATFFELKGLLGQTAEENIFRYYLLVFPFVHILTALLVEVSLVECRCRRRGEDINQSVFAFQFGMADRVWLKRVVHWATRKTSPRNKFKMLDKEFRVDPEWIDFETSKRHGE